MNALLVWALAMRVVPVAARVSGRELSGDRTLAISAASGLLFVAHPIATQAVTYVVQRMTSLAVCFGLIAFLLFLIGRDAPAGRRRYACWFVAALSWGLALGMALAGDGQQRAAIARLREALRIDPASIQAREMLVRLEGTEPVVE